MDEPRRITPDPPAQSARVRVSALATRQRGLVARRQLTKLGVGSGLVADWLRSSYLHRRLPGVYAVGHTAPSVEAELACALLYAGPGAMLSHATGAWWLELIPRPPATIHVSTPRRCVSRPGVTVHERCRMKRHRHRGLPVAPVAETLLQLAAVESERSVRRALAEAEYRGWLDLAGLSMVCGRGRAGSAALRRAAARHMPQLALTRSELERMLLELCESRGLPLPEMNARVAGYTVDALWRAERVIVETDGRDGHQSWERIQHDRERDLAFRGAGFVVLRYVRRQLAHQAAAVAADLEAALARGR